MNNKINELFIYILFFLVHIIYDYFYNIILFLKGYTF